jgi:hypothetical protein
VPSFYKRNPSIHKLKNPICSFYTCR